MAGGGVCLAGANEREVRSRQEMVDVLEQGTLLRATGGCWLTAGGREHSWGKRRRSRRDSCAGAWELLLPSVRICSAQ